MVLPFKTYPQGPLAWGAKGGYEGRAYVWYRSLGILCMTLKYRLVLACVAFVLLGVGVYFAAARGLLPFGAKPASSPEVSEKAKALPPLPEQVLGDPNAPLTVIEYASATCPHCAQFHRDVFPEFKKAFVDTGKVKFIFREFPLDNVAIAAFMVARCVDTKQYFPFLGVIFDRQREWVLNDPRESLFKIAQVTAGLEREKFEACLGDEALAQRVLDVRTRGEREHGIRSTPSFMVGDRRIEGEVSFEELSKVIKEGMALQNKAQE